jgi:hypothetical protein
MITYFLFTSKEFDLNKRILESTYIIYKNIKDSYHMDDRSLTSRLVPAQPTKEYVLNALIPIFFDQVAYASLELPNNEYYRLLPTKDKKKVYFRSESSNVRHGAQFILFQEILMTHGDVPFISICTEVTMAQLVSQCPNFYSAENFRNVEDIKKEIITVTNQY